jgi:Uma2 family endonuclease
MSSIVPITTVIYPGSGGMPMGETDEHIEETIRLRQLLKRNYARQRVYVSGHLRVFYEQGHPKKFIVPDVFVAKGLQQKDRRFYKLWVEYKPPDVIIEVTSKKMKKVDTGAKPQLYSQIRVPEYFLFDPTEDYLDPPLQGYRLIGDRHERIAAETDGALVSQELSLRLRAEGGHLMLYRLDTGERLLTAEESFEAEAEARQAAEAEVLRLREELRCGDSA